jgi:hypothetical protein
VQSKIRSTSFRQGAASGGSVSPGPSAFSPDGDTAPEIYRKQALRIEELERDNKRLAKDAQDGEKRWKKAEEQLEDIREADVDQLTSLKGDFGKSDDIEKLVSATSYIAGLLRT